jgi:hypothetical protein
MGAGFLYAHVDPRSQNYIKVGRTDRDVHARVREQENEADPFPHAILHQVEVSDSVAAESELKRRLAPYKANPDKPRNEVYKVPAKLAIAAMDAVAALYQVGGGDPLDLAPAQQVALSREAARLVLAEPSVGAVSLPGGATVEVTETALQSVTPVLLHRAAGASYWLCHGLVWVTAAIARDVLARAQVEVAAEEHIAQERVQVRQLEVRAHTLRQAQRPAKAELAPATPKSFTLHAPGERFNRTHPALRFVGSGSLVLMARNAVSEIDTTSGVIARTIEIDGELAAIGGRRARSPTRVLTL